jgi:UDP-glucose 4-epimerase
MKTVLITGAAGFLGSHLADEMLRRGYRVIGYDNLSHGSLRNLGLARLNPNFTFHQGDVCDLEALRKAAACQLDIVIHLAAFKIPRYGKATETLLTNSHGTLSALNLTVEHGAKFVITSTSDVYGKNPQLPFSEESDLVLGPSTVSRWAYAASKIFDEHLVLAMSEEKGIPATVIRIFGSYGPRQHLSWWGGPQSVFIDAVLRNQTIPIHGDGLQTRSFTYVSDTVWGIAAVAEADGLDREIVNIGSNVEITILELAHQVHRLCDVPWPLEVRMLPYDEIAARKYEDVRRRVPDITKAKRTIGFHAKVTLEEGLRKTIEWQRPLVVAERSEAASTKHETEVLMVGQGARG